MSRNINGEVSVSIIVLNRINELTPTINADFTSIDFGEPVVVFDHPHTEELLRVCEEATLECAKMVTNNEYARQVYLSLLQEVIELQGIIKDYLCRYNIENDWQNAFHENDCVTPSDFYDKFEIAFC